MTLSHLTRKSLALSFGMALDNTLLLYPVRNLFFFLNALYPFSGVTFLGEILLVNYLDDRQGLLDFLLVSLKSLFSAERTSCLPTLCQVSCHLCSRLSHSGAIG